MVEALGLLLSKRTKMHRKSEAPKNKLLGMGAGVDGLKTGHTARGGLVHCGHCQKIPIEKKSKQRLFVVLLGEPTSHQRILDAKKLLDLGFKGLQ